MPAKISRKIVRQEGDLIVVREALGQVAEYDVYRIAEGTKLPLHAPGEYLGGGSKREALALFRRLVALRP